MSASQTSTRTTLPANIGTIWTINDGTAGMRLQALALADALAAPMVSDRPDGLWPTLVCDVHGVSLGLAWSNRESLAAASGVPSATMTCPACRL